MKKLVLNRRAVLRGALSGGAVALGLPLLEIMLNGNGSALADGRPLPKRFVSWFWGNGVYLPTFEPAQTGAGWAPSEALKPLTPVLPYVNLCTGLRNRCRNLITHHEGMCVFSGWDIQPFDGPKQFNSHMGGPTIDQLVADAVGKDTPVRAIHVGTDRKLSSADGGTTLAALSHRGPNDPEYPIHDPQTIWTLLFGKAAKNDAELRLGIVGAVKDDLGRLQKRLGALDKQIMDKHLAGVAELEKKILALPPACATPAKPTETNPDVPNQDLTAVEDVMDELIALAFKCDVTRVATVLFHYGASHFHFHMLNQAGYEHHNDNSHQGPGDWQERYTAVVAYCMARLANLAGRLLAEKEPDGTPLLDSTILYASSDCGPGWSHSLRRQPIVLVGHGRGGLKYPGIHYMATPNTNPTADAPPAAGNTSDVLLTVLQAYDPAATQVGELGACKGPCNNGAPGTPPGSTTPLEEIRGAGTT